MLDELPVAVRRVPPGDPAGRGAAVGDDRRRQLVVAAALVVLLGAVVSPLLGAPLMGDDAVLHSRFDSMDASIASTLPRDLASTVGYGRTSILNMVQLHVVFHLSPSDLAYRSFQVALLALDLLLLWGIVRRLTNRFDVATIAVVATIVSFELRRYHDPIRDSHGLSQAGLACFLGAVLVALKPGRSTPARLAVVAALWSGALLYYEIHLMLLPAWILITLLVVPREQRRALTLAWLGPAVAFGAVTLVARVVATTAYDGTESNLQPGAVIRTFLDQLSGALPYSYRLVGDYKVGFTSPRLTPGVVLAASAAGVACWLVAGRARREPTLSRRSPNVALVLAGLAATMFLLPAAMIATSDKYQGEISPGVAYLPVLVQELGFGLAVALLYDRLRLRLGGVRLSGVVLTVAVVAAAGLTADTWRQSADSLVPTAVSRSLLRSSTANGLWAAVPPGSVVYLHHLGWSTSADDVERSGGPRVVTQPELGRTCPCEDPDVMVVTLADRHGAGLLLLAHAGRAEADILVRGRRLATELQAEPALIRFASVPDGRTRLLAARPLGDDTLLHVAIPAGADLTSLAVEGLEGLSHYT